MHQITNGSKQCDAEIDPQQEYRHPCVAQEHTTQPMHPDPTMGARFGRHPKNIAVATNHLTVHRLGHPLKTMDPQCPNSELESTTQWDHCRPMNTTTTIVHLMEPT